MPRSARSPMPVRLDAAQQASLRRALTFFSAHTRSAGERYAGAGRVGSIEPCEGGLVAEVYGTDEYETYWHFAGDRWVADCSCPVGFACKHAYAVALTLLATAQSGADTAAEPASLVELLRANPHPQRRAVILAPLLRHLPQWLRQEIVTSNVMAEPDPELLCWRLTDVVQHGGGALPHQLVPYRDRPELARGLLIADLTRWAERRRAAPTRALRLVCTLRCEHGAWAVAVQARLTSPRCNDEPRTTQQIQQLRNDLRRTPDLLPPDQAALLAALGDNPGWMYGASRETSERVSNGRLLRLARHAASGGLATWGADLDREAARRAGIEAGAPLRLREEPARMLPVCHEEGGETFVDLAFVWPDGGQRSLRDALLLVGAGDSGGERQPSLVLAGGCLSVLEDAPAPDVVARFEGAGGELVPAAERGDVFGRLAAAFPHLRDTLARHARVRAVRPLIALDLRDDEWLQVRLLAHDGEGPWMPGEPAVGRTVFEYEASGRWIDGAASTPAHDAPPSDAYDALAPAAADTLLPADAPPPDAPPPAEPADADVWFDEPDPQCVEPALSWLRRLPASSGTVGRPGGHQPTAADRQRGWWMRTSAKSMEALAAAWADRPAGVTFAGTPRTRRLLFGATLLRPQLRIASSGTDWFTIAAEWEQEGLQLDAADLARLRTATTPFVKLSGGWVRREAVQVHDEVAGVLADLGVEIGAGAQTISLWQLAGAAPSSLAALERLGADPAAVAAARALHKRVAAFRGLPAVTPPVGLDATLRPYQQHGLDFLVHASSLAIGALLADDMGLGKTVQALAWLEHLRAADATPQPSLVVCPTSVMHNWLREAARFTPDLRVLALERGAARRTLFEAVGRHDLVVTNYALLRRDLATWRDIPLRALILDEAQQLKNPDAVATRAALALTARHRVALTGTPLENRALDLWSIVECINPGYLGPRAAFEARFDRLDAPPQARALLAAKLRPILLRRTKAEVASDLPPRIEERIDCELTREQRLLYVAELRRSRELVERLGAGAGGLARHRIHILAALTRLRQICCHPALAGGKPTLESGKFQALFELLEPLLAEGHKVLLFSQFVECLKLLDAALRARGIRRHLLTGASVKRAEIVDAFHRDDQPGVFLISLKAGGTGLTLTAANYVVLFDPWWNPAVEAQAIDRTHRIGQERTVIAYRLLARGTIEEKIFELQQRKAALARDVLGEGGFGRALTRGDLDYLFAEV